LFGGLARIKKGEPLSLKMILEAQATLLGPDMPECGQVRTREVWLGSPTGRPETAVFVPPIGPALHDSLADWEDFLQQPPPMPALVRAALLHYQFLTIHPFLDGNGRTGRLLVLLFLAAEGRLPVPLLYISPFFERRRREYYDRLQAVRENGEMQQWCQYFLSAVEAQANDGVARARRLLDLREKYRFDVLGSRSRAAEVVEMLFENAYVTSTDVREKLEISNQGALNLIRSLESRGWLQRVRREGRGGRSLWLAWEIFRTMNDDPIATTTEGAT
jgi:Fic family protein